MIHWNAFTPWTALAGGMLIGAAAGILMLVNGRIAGISGIIGGLFARTAGDAPWRIAFLSGLICAPWIFGWWAPLPMVRIDAGNGVLAVAGLLVGIGTRYASGCTSGHGVCGLSRGSPRSLVATVSFMAAGFIATFLMRHVL